MSLLTDSEVRRQAHVKAEEMSQLRQKRLALVARKRMIRDDDAKIDTIKTFLALGGNLSMTSVATGISYNTLKQWKATKWWSDVITELRKAEKLELSANAKKILKKSLSYMEDRIENGDYVYDQKAGKLIRKPVSAKDLHKITIDLIDRTDKIDRAASDDHMAQDDSESKLQAIAEKLAALTLKAAEKRVRQTTGDVVDVEFKENE